MRVSEVLRKLADLTDSLNGEEDEPAPTPVGAVAVTAVAPTPVKPADTTVPTEPPETPELTSCDNTDETEPATMISPQQQELELLKKSQGVENNVSEFAVEDEEDSAANADADKMVRTLEPDEPMHNASPEDADFDKDLDAMREAAGLREKRMRDRHTPQGKTRTTLQNSRKNRPE